MRHRSVGALLVFAVLQGWALSREPVQAAVPPAGVDVDLYGATPTMAWAPDSRRVAVSAAYRYYGDESNLEQNRASLGVYVVDAASGRKLKLSTEQGYHPLWLDASTVAWGLSHYEDGTPGIFVSGADAPAPVRLGSIQSAHHTRLAKGGGVLFFDPDGGWSVADRATGKATAIAGSERDSWHAPDDRVVDQCLQKSGDARLVKGATDAEGWMLQVGVVRSALSPQPYIFGAGDDFLPPEHRGPVRGCLSPDGKQVASFSATKDGAFRLSIRPVL